jgi:hypothetical protein
MSKLRLLAVAWVFFVQAPVVDGRIDTAEWSAARVESLEGGGDVRLVVRRGSLYLGIRGPAAGLATVCVADASGVRLLHASAALGDARYERAGDGWAKRSDFAWQLRDTRAGGPVSADKEAFFAARGWLANASAAGAPHREFRIDLGGGVTSVAVAYLSTGSPMAVSRWPATADDDCVSVPLGQGKLAERGAFSPEKWHLVSGQVMKP